MDIHPELAPHQREAIRKMRDGSILWGGVGSGKTRAGLAYYAMTEQHEDLYVITTAKKRDSLDWEDEAAKFGIGKERRGTLHGVLHVDSWNNIHKYIDVKNAFFILDEQRLVGDGKWVKSFLKIARNNRWIMLSATPGDTWMDYLPVFLANGFYRNKTQFKTEHVVFAPFRNYPVVDHYINVGKLIKFRNQILVHMPYEKHTRRHLLTEWVEYDEEMMDLAIQRRWNPFKNEPIRDVAGLFYTMRQIVNSDPSRLKALWKLMEKHPRLIVFYNFDYELAILRTLRESEKAPDFTFAEYNGHHHDDLPSSPKWVYAVQYIAGSEGWNCVTTDATVFWSLTYSYKLWEQAHGRTDRLDTSFVDLWYYALRTKADIDMAIWRSLKSKKSFQTSHFDMTNPQFANFVVKKPPKLES